jgi:serine-type D-Ala-D-Ala carboxypeptidase (penicillin-binding protein 5/6)
MSSVLRGGRKRRRPGSRLLAVLALLAAPVAVAGALYLGDHNGRSGRGQRTPLAAAVARSPVSTPNPDALVETPPVTDVPLNGVDALHMRLHKPPKSLLLFDVDTGEVLLRRDPLGRLPIASLTKVMTALVVTQHSGPDEKVRITRSSLHYSGTGVGLLPKGRRVRLESLLNGMLIVSGNDAAIALADHVAGNQRHFVSLMNERARTLGLRCTHFVDPHGLSPGDRSCVRDLAVLTRLAMANHRITRIVRREHVSFRFPIKGGHLFLSGHNPLIRAGYRGAIGLKTGFTEEAGRCLIGVARRHGRTLGIVLLNDPNPLVHGAALLNAGFRTAER